MMDIPIIDMGSRRMSPEIENFHALLRRRTSAYDLNTFAFYRCGELVSWRGCSPLFGDLEGFLLALFGVSHGVVDEVVVAASRNHTRMCLLTWTCSG